MAVEKTVVVDSFSTLGLLGMLFIGLKLTGFIDWSWWWVLCSFWIGVAVLMAILVVLAVGFVVVLGVDWLLERIR